MNEYIPRKSLVCNWKSEPSTHTDARLLAQQTVQGIEENISVVLVPPSPYLQTVHEVIQEQKSGALLGAQDISPIEEGVVTGDETSRMLIDEGVRYVIVGHSERRYILGESDEIVEKKMHTSVSAGLIPILCVGERKMGTVQSAIDESVRQISYACEGIPPDAVYVIAYEPVWAIGGGAEVDPVRVSDVILGILNYVTSAHIKKVPTILYGGSVHCGNIEALLYYRHIGGFLVGSASLDVQTVRCIIHKMASTKY